MSKLPKDFQSYQNMHNEAQRRADNWALFWFIVGVAAVAYGIFL